MKRIIVCLLAAALAPSLASADSGPAQKHVESIRKRVAQCVDKQRRVVVETYDDRRLQGYISEAGADDFTLTYGRQTSTFAYQDVKKIKWQWGGKRQVEGLAVAAVVVGALFGFLVLLGGLKG